MHQFWSHSDEFYILIYYYKIVQNFNVCFVLFPGKRLENSEFEMVSKSYITLDITYYDAAAQLYQELFSDPISKIITISKQKMAGSIVLRASSFTTTTYSIVDTTKQPLDLTWMLQYIRLLILMEFYPYLHYSVLQTWIFQATADRNFKFKLLNDQVHHNMIFFQSLK